MKTRFISLTTVLIAAVFVLSSCNLLPSSEPLQNGDTQSTSQDNTNNNTQDTEGTASGSSLADLPRFDSCKALQDKVEEMNKENDNDILNEMYRNMKMGMPMEMAAESDMAMAEGGGGGAEEYSTTNVQVEGVDEADIVKNDGEYIYSVSGNRVAITKAYPPEDAELVTTIDYSDDYGDISEYVNDMFLYENSLVVFGTRNYTFPPRFIDRLKGVVSPYGYYYPNYTYRDVTFIDIYDIADKKEPELKRSLEFEGYYTSARMIEDKVYFVLNKYIDYYAWNDGGTIVPQYRDSLTTKVGGKEDTFEDAIDCGNVRYMEPFNPNSYIIVAAFDADNYEGTVNKDVVIGSSDNVYASSQNLYIANTDYRGWWDWGVPMPMMDTVADDGTVTNEGSDGESATTPETLPEPLPDESATGETFLPPPSENATVTSDNSANEETMTDDKNTDDTEDFEDVSETTTLYKFALDNGAIEFKGKAKIPGRVLNQYSMDEYNNYFRVATTVGHVSRTESTTENNVFILDEDLKTVGEITDIAPGEDIYSARFMGARGYLVTFKKIDPFFVLDLADPENPAVLGKLKIPGYSDYLHPYDENHIIGIGKETEEAEEEAGDFSWYQGVKIAIFDVTDVTKPKEMHKVIIGDRGTDSPILWNPKAFLFDKEKELMVIPITIAEIDDELKNDPTTERWTYGDTVFQGALVYNITLDDGMKEIGRISHLQDEDAYIKSGYYFNGYGTEINRSLYMNNYLYTISTSFIKANNLDNDLKEEAVIDLGYEDPYGYEIY